MRGCRAYNAWAYAMSKGHDRLGHGRAALSRCACEAGRRPRRVLAEACTGDEALRLEVESLIAQNASDGLFTRGAAVAAAGLVSDTGHSTLTGRQLGAYEIVAPIGAGGMGEVYRARDTRLGRDVAIKLLPPAFTSHPDRLARFEREARCWPLSTIPHRRNLRDRRRAHEPAIGRALVLELVEGETLAERIACRRIQRRCRLETRSTSLARSPMRSMPRTRKASFTAISSPPTSRSRREGVVKVLDFGLAKLEAAAARRGWPSDSPTITVNATREGVILGTAAYMSPEQARGQAVDKRTDIWAFGCVLYEMLTGRAAFAGDDGLGSDRGDSRTRAGSDTVSRQHARDIRRLLQRCFEKDMRQRMRDIGDAGAEIEDALSPHVVSRVRAFTPSRSPDQRRRTVVAAGRCGLALGRCLRRRAGSRRGKWPLRASGVRSRRPSRVHAGARVSPDISPDGKWVAYMSNARGPTDVWVKFIAGGDPANLTATAEHRRCSPPTTSAGWMFRRTAHRSPSWRSTGADRRSLGDSGTARRRPTQVLPAGNSGCIGRRMESESLFVRTGGPLGRCAGRRRCGMDRTSGSSPSAKAAQHIHWPRWSPDGRSSTSTTVRRISTSSRRKSIACRPTGGPIEPVVRDALAARHFRSSAPMGAD